MPRGKSGSGRGSSRKKPQHQLVPRGCLPSTPIGDRRRCRTTDNKLSSSTSIKTPKYIPPPDSQPKKVPLIQASSPSVVKWIEPSLGPSETAVRTPSRQSSIKSHLSLRRRLTRIRKGPIPITSSKDFRNLSSSHSFTKPWANTSEQGQGNAGEQSDCPSSSTNPPTDSPSPVLAEDSPEEEQGLNERERRLMNKRRKTSR